MRKLEASELEITLNPKISQYKLKNKVYPKGDQPWVCLVRNLGKQLRNGNQKNNNYRWSNRIGKSIALELASYDSNCLLFKFASCQKAKNRIGNFRFKVYLKLI